MKGRRVFLGCTMMAIAAGACAAQTPKLVVDKRPARVAPAKPRAIAGIHPARFVLLDSVGVSYDEAGEASPVLTRDLAIVSGKRLVLEGGLIVESAALPDSLLGFRSMPAHLGGGYVFWSDDYSYHAPTFLGKLTAFANVGARGGVRPWFDSFVLRTEIGPLEVTPSSFTVRRTELARFSEMISFDGKMGVRTDAVGRMEASVDRGKTFRPLVFEDGKKYIGPLLGPSNSLRFYRDSSSDFSGRRPDRPPPDTRVLAASGALIPFDPKANDPMVLEPPSWAAPPEEPALTRRFAPPELGLATVAGALVPGDQVIFLKESALRVLSAKTGNFIHDLPISLGSQEFAQCQPMTLGEDVFLACKHASGAHLYALRETPTTVQLEATFPEPAGFVAGLGQRFLFLGRCGSTPPTVSDFPGYGLSAETADGGEPDPNAPPPEAPAPPEAPPEKPANEAAVCVRVHDGTWVERRIDGLKDRQKTLFLPGDDGEVTVVVFDKPDPDKLTPPVEGVRFIHVDTTTTGFDSSNFFAPESSESRLQTISRDVWLDAKDGSVHGWTQQLPKTDEPLKTEESEESDEPSEGDATGLIVGVQIKTDGTIEKQTLPKGSERVVVGGPYAVARATTDAGSSYYESTDGGRSFAPVNAPLPADFIEYTGGDVEGCSIVGCALGGGIVRLGWGSDVPPATPAGSPDKPNDSDALTSKVFDPHTLVPAKPQQELRCRLEAKERNAAAEKDLPFALTTATHEETKIGAVVDHKWTALGTMPFEVKPAFQVLFDDVNVDALSGDGLPVLRSTVTNPVGLFLRTKEFRFDLAPGPKRKPVAFAPEARGSIAAEIDRETFVLFDPRLGEVVLVRGATVRSLMRINQVPDVNHATLTLARRVGAGDDVLGVALIVPDTGDILLGDLDLGRGTIGPLRIAGNMRKLDTGASCVRAARDYRMVVPERLSVQIDAAEEGRGGLFGSSLITLGPGKTCLEASEMRLSNEATLVVRYSGAGPGGHPAMLHDHGKSLRATCSRE